MKKSLFGLTALVFTSLLILSASYGCRECRKDKELFSAVFMTDVHLEYGRNAVEGFRQALDSACSLKPDFIITGGDLIADALQRRYSFADSLYNLYLETIKTSAVPVYNTMGNHEIYGIYKNSGADPAHPEYGEKMFAKRIGPSYYSFDHEGWKFMILNSIDDTGKGSYIGVIDSAQIEWIKQELSKTDKTTPIVISTHIPFIAAFTQKYEGSTVAADSTMAVYNSKEVLDLFSGYNLKLVLQGHLHTLEDVYIDGIHFLTGGAVSAAWWTGPFKDYEEGFIYLTFRKNDFEWKFIDYGWQVKKRE